MAEVHIQLHTHNANAYYNRFGGLLKEKSLEAYKFSEVFSLDIELHRIMQQAISRNPSASYPLITNSNHQKLA